VAETRSGRSRGDAGATRGDSPIDEAIWLTVCAIPAGRIATYGDVAERAGLPGAARRVGAALRKLPEGSEVPWHRVVNARGQSSLPPGPGGAGRQLARLADEGVFLGRGGASTLARYRWR
jgi:methylated-DNA-protein-cysteine methyltransferase-like protein